MCVRTFQLYSLGKFQFYNSVTNCRHCVLPPSSKAESVRVFFVSSSSCGSWLLALLFRPQRGLLRKPQSSRTAQLFGKVSWSLESSRNLSAFTVNRKAGEACARHCSYDCALRDHTCWPCHLGTSRLSCAFCPPHTVAINGRQYGQIATRTRLPDRLQHSNPRSRQVYPGSHVRWSGHGGVKFPDARVLWSNPAGVTSCSGCPAPWLGVGWQAGRPAHGWKSRADGIF